jgi:hypothetical protein
MNNLLNTIMGVWEDKREPATVHFPSAAQCPVEDCQDRGRYTNCYLPNTMDDCHIYERNK